MNDQTTLATLAAFGAGIGIYLWWGFRYLPAERWQIVATLPVDKTPEGAWQGVNLTWYGLLTANAYLVAVLVLLVLLGSLGVPPLGVVLLTAALLGCCVPASRLVARLVEKKAHTFTVGGAVFVGMLITPFVVLLLNRTAGVAYNFSLPVMASYAAIAIAYAFGEGLGRLACISFGCCYGKPLSAADGWIRRLFSGRGFRFYGSTKKAAYADNLEGAELLPIQAVTAVLYILSGLVGIGLFLAAQHLAAFLLAAGITQGWRALSETWRADYRGTGRISAYQIMGLLGLFYALGAAMLVGNEVLVTPVISSGLQQLWTPAVLFFLQALWVVIFFYTGRSTVTGATIRYHVRHDLV